MVKKNSALTAIILIMWSLPALGQSAEELLSRGRQAYLNYNFGEAARLYAQAKKKARRADENFAETYDTYRHQLQEAENFLERVENIQIIDSISVPRADFFRHYRLPASAGRLGGAEDLPKGADKEAGYVFTNEGGDYKIWAQPDTTGHMRPMEAIRMTDGNWSVPAYVWEDLSEDSDAIYPFMMSDGVTLYYADNGDASIGGYDIMVATRDATDGSFLQPSNLGFPYNSPYDDYLLAIDEQNGVGWWATDRNQLDDDITIYVFITNDLRNNYPADTEGLICLARIDDYVMTQPEDAEYDELLATIRAIDPTQRDREPEFTFPAKGGRIYHNYDELPDMKARGTMRRYQTAAAELTAAEKALADMRMSYYETASESLGAKIDKAEKQLEAQRAKVNALRSDVYKSLGN